MIASFIHILMKYALIALLYPFRLFPVKKNRVLMLSDLNGKYSDNPKYLTEWLLSNRPGKYEIVFALSDLAEKTPEGVKKVKIGSIPYYFHALTAGTFVTNSGGISYLPFRKKQTVINTWHGGGAYKKFNLDFFERSETNLKNARLNEKKTTYMLGSCLMADAIYQSAMLIPREKMLHTGSPRNDIMFEKDEKRQEIREKLGLGEKKLCLYAPTFRRSSKSVFSTAESALYAVDAEKTLEALRERFGGEWVFGFRYHPKITERRKVFDESVVDYSDYNDMQELLFAADVLINDYSSSMWDFALTGKPCFLYCEDLEEYQAKEDFYTPIGSWPFPLAEDMEGLLENIRSFGEEPYRKAVEAHYKELGSFETGHASEAVCLKMEERLGL